MKTCIRFGLPIWLLLAAMAFRRASGQEAASMPAASLNWTEAEIAFKEAMNRDLSHGVGKGRTQPGAIAAWEKFLKREDAAAEQRVFATWRVASLWAYNYDPKRGETYDMAKAEKWFKKARAIMPDLISYETINATTVYASLPGTPSEQARRKAECYRWLRSRTPEMINASERTVHRGGWLVGREFHSQAPPAPRGTPEERHQYLSMLLKHGKDNVTDQITEFIEWTGDGWAVLALLEAVSDVADPADMETWRNVKPRRRDEWESHSLRALDKLEAIPAGAMPSAITTSPSSAPTTKSAPEGASVAPAPREDGPRSAGNHVPIIVGLIAAGVCLAAFLVYRFSLRRRPASRA